MVFVETPSFFFCPHVDRAACTNFSTQTVELRSSKSREILPFPFLLFLSFLCSLPRTVFPFSFVLSFSSFLLFFTFPFSSYFPSFLFLLLFFSFSPPFWSNIHRMGQRRKFPPHCLMPFVWPLFFSLNFLFHYFLYDIIQHVD